MMKISTRIKKSKDKTSAWYKFDLSVLGAEDVVRDMVLSMPKGVYHLYNREYGENLVDAMFPVYGMIPSLIVNERILFGLEVTHPQKIRVSFTHDLDIVEIL